MRGKRHCFGDGVTENVSRPSPDLIEAVTMLFLGPNQEFIRRWRRLTQI